MRLEVSSETGMDSDSDFIYNHLMPHTTFAAGVSAHTSFILY